MQNLTFPVKMNLPENNNTTISNPKIKFEYDYNEVSSMCTLTYNQSIQTVGSLVANKSAEHKLSFESC